MTMIPDWIRETSDGVVLSILVQPRASKTEFVGIHGDVLRFRVCAPPVDGAANDALCVYLAELFRASKSAVTVCSGHGSRQKQILLKGISMQQVQVVLFGPMTSSRS